MIRFGLGIIGILLAAYFWKRRSNNKPDTHEGNTEYIRTYNPSYKKSIIIKAVDGDKKHRTRGMAIGLLFIGLLLAGCSNSLDGVKKDIDKAEKEIIKIKQESYKIKANIEDLKSQLSGKATLLSGQLAIIESGKSFICAKRGGCTSITGTHATAEIPEKVTEDKPLYCTKGYAKCESKKEEGVIFYKDVCYDDYILGTGTFAGYYGAYNNKSETCLIFEDESTLKSELGE